MKVLLTYKVLCLIPASTCCSMDVLQGWHIGLPIYQYMNFLPGFDIGYCQIHFPKLNVKWEIIYPKSSRLAHLKKEAYYGSLNTSWKRWIFSLQISHLIQLLYRNAIHPPKKFTTWLFWTFGLKMKRLWRKKHLFHDVFKTPFLSGLLTNQREYYKTIIILYCLYPLSFTACQWKLDGSLFELRGWPLMIWGGQRKKLIENGFIFSAEMPFENYFSWRRASEIFFFSISSGPSPTSLMVVP